MDDANRVSNIWDWNVTADSSHSITGRAVAAADITHSAPKYQNEWWRCMPVADDGSVGGQGGHDQWLTEYKGLAEVDSASKTLLLRSGINEQAIQLWLIDDVPYYSSYNTTEGRYYLKRYNPETASIQTIASDFETYNLSEGDNPGYF
jgi:hypothetical protein